MPTARIHLPVSDFWEIGPPSNQLHKKNLHRIYCAERRGSRRHPPPPTHRESALTVERPKESTTCGRMLQRRKFQPPKATVGKPLATGVVVRRKLRAAREPALSPERLDQSKLPPSYRAAV